MRPEVGTCNGELAGGEFTGPGVALCLGRQEVQNWAGGGEKQGLHCGILFSMLGSKPSMEALVSALEHGRT